MKKFAVSLLSTLMLTALVACGGKEEASQAPSQSMPTENVESPPIATEQETGAEATAQETPAESPAETITESEDAYHPTFDAARRSAVRPAHIGTIQAGHALPEGGPRAADECGTGQCRSGGSVLVRVRPLFHARSGTRVLA